MKVLTVTQAELRNMGFALANEFDKVGDYDDDRWLASIGKRALLATWMRMISPWMVPR